jgi:small-conductance mechanosensitive channel
VKALDQLTLAALGALLAAAVAGYVSTESTTANAGSRVASDAPAALIDRRPFRTAQRLALLADTRADRDLAREALRLGDHSIDLAFTIALLEAAEHPPALTPETRGIQARIDSTKRLIADDSVRAARLAAGTKRGGTAADRTETELELVNAQLELYRGELADAKDDLIRAGGDPKGRIRQMVADHDSTEHDAAGALKPAATEEVAAEAKTARSGMLGRLERWRSLRDKQTALNRARDETTAGIPLLTARRQEFAQHGGQVQADSGADQLARTRHLAADQKVLAGLTQRIEDQVSLLDIYSRWSALVTDQRRAALHSVLLDCVWLLLILLATVGIGAWLERVFAHFAPERRLQTLRTVTRFALRGLAVVAAALILIGPPSQLATIIGLAGAGLTVALKDFIVGFFGWFALMGRNGMRVGDWVEINGVSGVVIDITPFHTVLLETGNWTDAGHPTGRQVTFNNAFAIEGHYFNFSTSGQWLWDEVELDLPSATAPAMIEAIRKIVTDETAENSRLAEQEWGRVTAARAVSGFSGEPAIDVRPGPAGTHVLVRYIIRAQDRHRFRTRLYQAVVELLGQASPAVPQAT